MRLFGVFIYGENFRSDTDMSFTLHIPLNGKAMQKFTSYKI